MMEAAASGLLVVTTDNSSKQEFIHDAVNGILGNSAKKIAAKIVAITNNKSRFEEVVVKGRKSMEVIDISTTIRKEMELLKQYL